MPRFISSLLALAVLSGCAAGSGAGGAAGKDDAARHAADASAGGPGVAWSWEAPSPASVGMPAADDRAVAITYGHQFLVLLDGKGKVQWEATRLGLRDVAPRLDRDLVLAATDDGLVAFRRADGTKVWDTTLAARANTPVVIGDRAITSTWEGQLVSVDLASGKVAWSVPLPGGSVAPPAGGVAGAAGVVVAIWQREDVRGAGALGVQAATGRTLWATAVEPGGVGGPAVTPDGAVVFVGGDVVAHALSLTDGRERWRTPLAGAGSPEVPPVPVGDNAILVAHRLAGLDLLDTATGRRLWQIDVEGIAVRGGPVVGPEGSFAFPLDDGRLLLAGPNREMETRQAPNRISGVAAGPNGLLIAATRGAAVNSAQATPRW